MSCSGSSRASAGGLRAATGAGAFGHRDGSAGNSAVKRLALLLGEGGLPVGGGQGFVGAAVAAAAATAGCRLCTAGPGELLKAPPTRTVQAGSWSIGPGRVRAGLIPLRGDPPAGESGDHFSGSLTWVHTARLRYSKKKKKRRYQHQEKEGIGSFPSGSRLGKNVCEVHRLSSWKKLYTRRACCPRGGSGSATNNCRNQCRISVIFRAVEYGEQAKAKSVRVRRKAGSGLPGSDAGPPAARRTRTQNAQPFLLHCEVSSSSPNGVPRARRTVSGWDHQERRKSHLRSRVLDKERRRQRRGDLARVPDLMPMRLDSPRLTGPPTTRKREQSAVQAECAPINLKGSSTCKFFSFDHFSSQCSWISSSCSTDCKFIENRRPFYCICHDDEELKVRNTSDLEAPSEFHTHDVVQKPDEKVSQFSTENPYSCCMPALRQRYHPYRRINWGTKRRKILFRKPAANTNNFITGYDTNSLVDASADAGSKFLGLPFNNVLAYTAFIHDDNDDDDEDAVNGDQGKRQYFKKQRSYDTREKGNQQTEIQNEIERSSIDNDLPETTTCIVVPGGYLFDAFKSTKIIASETSDESFFHETDVRDDNFSRIKNKSKKTPLRSHRCCKDKYSSADDFRNDKRDYLYESKRRSRNEKKPHTARYSKSSIYGCLQSELSLFKDTNPIYFPKSRKARNSVEGWSKSYTLFFILYLLALPLLCSTNPSPQVPSALAQKSPLSRNEDYTQRNVSSTAQQYTPSNNGQQQHLRQGQQVVQERQIVHPYNEYSWEVNQINPWLSACDLAGPAPADLQGSCGPPEVPKYCPLPCAPKSPGDSNVAFREVIERYEIVSGKIKGRKSRSWSGLKRSPGEDVLEEEKEDNSKRGADRGGRKSRADTSPGKRTAPEQCLFYLEESHKRDICRDDFGQGSPLSFLTPRENRYWFTSGLRLRHCCEHAVVNALTPGKDGPLEDVLNGGRKCVDALDKLLLVDALAARLHCEFEEVLARYDCGQSYSVIHNCTHCKVSPNFTTLQSSESLSKDPKQISSQLLARDSEI